MPTAVSLLRQVVLFVFVAISATAIASAQGLVQEVIPASRNQPPETRSPGAWNAIKLAPKILAWVTDLALQSRVDAEVNKLRADALKRAPKGGGTLIVVGISESKVPDNNGNRQRYFLSATIGPSAASAKEAVDKFHAEARIDAGPPDKFIRRDTLLWVTP